MIVPANASASLRARADLPLAVGPAMTSTKGALAASTASRLGRFMPLIVTLIAAEHEAANLARHAAAVAAALGTADGPFWLGPIACDLALDADDVVVQGAENRRKRLLVADLEATIIENEMLDELADLAGLRERVAAITRRAMNGEIDFAAALAARVALLAGLEKSVLAAAAARIRITAGAAALVATMRRAG